MVEVVVQDIPLEEEEEEEVVDIDMDSADQGMVVLEVDLEGVEVVRGPQSALYGRNTYAGAINYVSRPPSDEFRSTVEATAAEDGRYELFGAISGPLAEGLSGRLVGGSS